MFVHRLSLVVSYIHVINSVEESVAKGYHSYSYNSGILALLFAVATDLVSHSTLSIDRDARNSRAADRGIQYTRTELDDTRSTHHAIGLEIRSLSARQIFSHFQLARRPNYRVGATFFSPRPILLIHYQ